MTPQKPARTQLAHDAAVSERLASPFPADTSLVSRRALLAGVGAVAIGAGGTTPLRAEAPATVETVGAGIRDAGQAGAAVPVPLTPSAQYEETLRKIIGTGTPVEGRVTVELPEDAENGNIVPYKIAVESPMTEADHIVRVHLLSTQNPQASVATFHFTPLSGKATVSGRMRLAKTQDVVAVAVTSSNTLLIGRQLVNVGIGGCGSE